ncbi:MAG: tRNA (guanosine(37)-N1)-methyltransferase TrmD [Bacteroidia bacterium]|nr:tRNA (guanosine(37)-N1)-methyltransferase TrmD [Bacteroidia bacterium]MDW8133510.1 tRNA (guanosine(37)-N1)-methyltransferase TrmD [Bacteroidia bacterium]
MHIDIITAVPEIFNSPLQASILGRAQKNGIVSIQVHNLHNYSPNGRIDDYPYGGGAGMIIRVDVVVAAMRHLQHHRQYDEIIYLTPDGHRLTQALLNRLSLCKALLLIAGHYKGIDERVRHFVTLEVSIGDYVLTGGEIPALVLIDGIVRLLPGALSDASSALEDSFQEGLLGSPLYTRPREFEGLRVPDILLSGNHQAIAAWRAEQSRLRTLLRRPDLNPNLFHDEVPLPPKLAEETASQLGKSGPPSQEEEPS